jgi:hypothetical protein
MTISNSARSNLPFGSIVSYSMSMEYPLLDSCDFEKSSVIYIFA